MSYCKLATTLLGSTLWAEDANIRLTWVTMLLLKDAKGEVHTSIPGLAHFARVPLQDCERALEKFLSPDKYSNNKDFEGRRIEEIEGGWFIINHEHYRDLDSDVDRKKKDAARQQRKRNRDKSIGIVTVSRDAGVTNPKSSRQIEHTDTDANTETNTESDSNPEKEPESSPNQYLKQTSDAFPDEVPF